jgi:hypothetical protein
MCSKVPKVYPVDCLPNEMQRLFHRGGAYYSGIMVLCYFYILLRCKRIP